MIYSKKLWGNAVSQLHYNIKDIHSQNNAAGLTLMSMGERLYKFLETKNIRPSLFERRSGLSGGFCGKIGKHITDGSLLLISKAFPDLNIDWLKTGEGEMIKDDTDLAASYPEANMLAMSKMLEKLIRQREKDVEANLINAEANRQNAKNLSSLITILESKTVNIDSDKQPSDIRLKTKDIQQ